MKVLYSEFSRKFWLDVASELGRRYDWQPCYWVATPPFAAEVRARFPQAIFHSTLDAVRSIPADEFRGISSVLDQPLLDSLASVESIALKMMDRMDAIHAFPYYQRIRHYHRLVSYWQAVLDHLQPDIACFVTVPHMVYDFVLYSLCRLRGIPTLLFSATNIQGYSYLMAAFDQEGAVQEGYRRLLKTDRGEPVRLPEDIEAYLQSLKGDYRQVPLYVRYLSKTDLYRDETPLIRRLIDLRRYPQRLRKQWEILRAKLRPPLNYLKEAGKTPEDSNVSGLNYRVFRWRAKRVMRHWDRYYHRLAEQNVDLERPYIFVGLSYQPEATTSPQGKAYVHLRLMVEMLAKAIPEGWVLYVKEHPAQFDPSWSFRTQTARNKEFYDDLAAIPGVKLVSTKTSTYDLIDHAVAVAAVTGTVGWQAVVRGKPALVFGFPWYYGCEGVFHIERWEDCKAAVEALRQGYKVDERKVRLFCKSVADFGLRLPIEEKMTRWQQGEPLSPTAVADAMASFYERVYARSEN